jgi:hypothetical protein
MAFTKRERCIYKYWNGTKTVACDPLAVHRRLLMFPEFDLETDMKLLQQVTNQRAMLEAFERLVKAARHAFKVAEFAEDDQGVQTGLEDSGVLELLFDFGQWMQDLKNAQAPQQGPPSVTESVSLNGERPVPITVSTLA